MAISVTKMRPEEVMVLQFTHRPPLYPRLPMRASVAQTSVELWGELEPRFGAWSPPPNIPVYKKALQDHRGDELSDPCALGAIVSLDHPGSCYKGAYESNLGYEARELAVDPSVAQLAAGNLTLELEATGRTDNGGFLQPSSKAVKWLRGATVVAAAATKAMYRAYCVELSVAPILAGGNALNLGVCKPKASQGLQRFKFG